MSIEFCHKMSLIQALKLYLRNDIGILQNIVSIWDFKLPLGSSILQIHDAVIMNLVGLNNEK